jgi:hypothetical protein
VLRSHRNFIIKPCGTRKARMCYDGSKRAAQELRFAQTYASCIDQPYMRLFFALSAKMGLVLMGADCTNTYANSPSVTQATNTSGLTTPMSISIALAMARKLPARCYYQYSRLCSDTRKPVNCGKSTWVERRLACSWSRGALILEGGCWWIAPTRLLGRKRT